MDIKRGDDVWTWYDTGALGSTQLRGKIVSFGRVTFVVEWESGIRNRIYRNMLREPGKGGFAGVYLGTP